MIKTGSSSSSLSVQNSISIPRMGTLYDNLADPEVQLPLGIDAAEVGATPQEFAEHKRAWALQQEAADECSDECPRRRRRRRRKLCLVWQHYLTKLIVNFQCNCFSSVSALFLTLNLTRNSLCLRFRWS
jgi:hypothetical protein